MRQIRQTAVCMTTQVANSRRGVSAVEFVVVLPVMVMILAGTGDYCRFAATTIAVCNAARSGAGHGCIHPYDSYTETSFVQECRARVEEEFSGISGFDPSLLAVSVAKEGTAPADRFKVTVGYPFRTVIHWGFLPSTIPVQRTSVLPMIR